MNNLIKNWMETATPAQQKALAKFAGTSRTYLYQLANGTRKASSEMAAKLENAAELLSQKENIGLLPRYFVSKICNGCHYAREKRRIK